MSSRTRDPREFKRRDAILTKLYENAQVEVLLALKEGRITIEQLVDADRNDRLRSRDLLPDLVLLQPLWESVENALPKMGGSLPTRRRYRVSFAALRSKARNSLGDGASVRDLSKVDWKSLHELWDRSPADWNHMRRAVSAFLTVVLGEKYHPFRRAVVVAIPKAAEVGRVPDITPELFWQVIEQVPQGLKGCYVTLVATGMRVGEYLRCTRFNLRPETHAIEVPGTKTAASAATIYVDESLWPWIVAGIPCPLGHPGAPPAEGVQHDTRYKRLRRAWAAACARVGVRLRLHDLRHCMGQWSVDAGVPEAKVQSAMRHKTAAMTRRYTMSKDRREVAEAMGAALSRRRAV
jgi:integrase